MQADPELKGNINMEFPKVSSLDHMQSRPTSSQSTSSNVSQAWGNVQKKVSYAKSFVLTRGKGPSGPQSTEASLNTSVEDDGLPIFNRVHNQKNYKYSMAALAIGTIFLFFSLFALPVIVISPYKFVVFFSLSMVCYLFGMAYMNGPQSYLKKLSTRKNRVPSLLLIISMIMALYSSVIASSY